MTQTLRQSALSPRHRDELRRALGDERRHTLESAGQLDRDVRTVQVSRHDTPTDDEHDPEGPTLAFEHSQSSAILGQTRVHLAQIDDAIVRIDGGSFEVCVTCGNDIPAARLDARPYSTQCVACASRVRR